MGLLAGQQAARSIAPRTLTASHVSLPHIVVITPLLLLTLLLLLLLPPPVPPVPEEEEEDDTDVEAPVVVSVSSLHAGIIHAAETTAPIPKNRPIDLDFIDITSRKKLRREKSTHRTA
jgi:hypothetical protein